MDGVGKSRRTFLKTLGLVGGAAPFGCTGLGARKPNVILLVADTLRADHVGCYGCAEPLTPCIDALRHTATQVSRPYSTASWTLSSHASMFTGRFPFQHRAHLYETEMLDKRCNEIPLGTDFPTLAQFLKREGYATGAISANPVYVTVRHGMARGFRAFDSMRQYVPLLELRIRHWLDENPEAPFFLFVNYMDAHFPFNNMPCPRVTSVPVERKNDMEDYRRAILPKGSLPTEDMLRTYRTRYKLGVANVDAAIGHLLDDLKARGLFDNTLIVLTSDHGESLGEHNLIAHGMDLYDELIRVPLIIKYPGQTAPCIDDTVASSVDIPHFVFKGMPGDMARRAQEAFPYRPGNHIILAEHNYSLWVILTSPHYGERFRRTRKAIIDWPLKLIRSSDGAHELYDLTVDPHETHNLVAQNPGVANRLKADLERFLAAHHVTIKAPSFSKEPAGLSEPEEAELKALGYL